MRPMERREEVLSFGRAKRGAGGEVRVAEEGGSEAIQARSIQVEIKAARGAHALGLVSLRLPPRPRPCRPAPLPNLLPLSRLGGA